MDDILRKLSFLVRYSMVRIPMFMHGQLHRRIIVYRRVAASTDEGSLVGTQPTPPEHDHLVLLSPEEQVLDIYSFYQLLFNKDTRFETHICFFKQRKAGARRLEGESASGAFLLDLDGYEIFEVLLNKVFC